MKDAVLENKITDLMPEFGIRKEQRLDVARTLSDALADAFRLKFNLQAMHWNVEGPMFYSLHQLTENQYEAIEETVDTIAERIRALGLPAPESLQALDERSILEDLPSSGDLKSRVEQMVTDFERAGLRLKTIIELAETNGDIKTADLLTEQLGMYEEFAWMLRASAASS